jgi:uncharacterized membrane protein YidH (DUF202 family)
MAWIRSALALIGFGIGKFHDCLHTTGPLFTALKADQR